MQSKLLYLKILIGRLITSWPFGKTLNFLYRGRIPFYGTRIVVPKHGVSSTAASLFWKMYESAEIRFIKRYVNTKYDVIELGSSLGATSCQIAKILNGKKRLVCVEPNHNMIPLLKANLENNTPNQPVTIINAAIGPIGGEKVHFKIDKNNLTSHISSRKNENKIYYSESITLNQLLTREGISKYAMVCDIEGAEVFLLRDEPQSFAKCNLLIIEMHDFSYNNDTYHVEDMIKLALKIKNFELIDRYGNVFVFRLNSLDWKI